MFYNTRGKKIILTLLITSLFFLLAARPDRTFPCRAEEASEVGRVEEIERIAGAGTGTGALEGTAPEEKTWREKYDFSDLSHWNLTVSAWECLADKDYDGTFAYAQKCLELYKDKAREMAKKMKRFTRPGHEDDYALVNDVATCHYIMGEAYMKQGKPGEAVQEFNTAIDEYPYAQCWDPKGWFWKVAEISKKNIEKIKKAENNPSHE